MAFKTKVKECIFCGRKPLSREHIWSEWTYEIFPRKYGQHERVVLKNTLSDRTMALSDKKKFQGDVSSIKVKAVCERNCNNGWMSRLEERAIPVLTKLMKAEECRLSADEQQLVSTWIAMKILVIEYGTSAGPLSTQADREYVMNYLKPPPNWDIFIAASDGLAWRSGFMRNVAGLRFVPKGEPSPAFVEAPANTQYILLGIGRLLFAVFTSTISFNFEFPAHMSHIIRRISPFKHDVVWPPIESINDHAIDNGLAVVFNNYLDALKWVPGPS